MPKQVYLYLLLIIITILGFLVRLYKIDNPVADWHSWRQADTASVTRIYVQNGIDLLHPKYHDISFLQTGKDNPQGFRFVEFPIYNSIHALLINNFPVFSLEVWGRLLSTICSTISIILIYILGKKFLGEMGGLLASLFFAFLPFNIYFSRVILPEPMAVMFSLAFMVMFVKWLGRPTFFYLGISGLFFSLALLLKPFAIFFAIPMAYLAFQKFGILNILKNKTLWISAALGLLPLILWRIWMMQFPEGIPFYSWMYEGILRFRPAFFRWIFGERIGELILGKWGIFIFAAGLLAKSKNIFSYFPLSLGLGAFIYMFAIAEANVRHDYYQTFIIPAISLILARGVLELWHTTSFHKLATRLFIIGSVMFMLGSSWYQVREFYKINHPEIIEAGSIVDSVAPKDALIVAPYNGDTALLYQTKRAGWPYLTYSIEQLISMGATYYVSVNPKDAETQDAYRKFILIKETDKYIVLKLEPKPRN